MQMDRLTAPFPAVMLVVYVMYIVTVTESPSRLPLLDSNLFPPAWFAHSCHLQRISAVFLELVPMATSGEYVVLEMLAWDRSSFLQPFLNLCAP